MFSFLIRVWGIQFGLPFAYHPDEQQYILPAVNVVSGEFEPQAYYNPTLYPYLIGAVYTATYLGLRLFNAFPDFFTLDAAWNPATIPWTTGMIYLARYTSVAAGVLTTLVVYQVAAGLQPGCRGRRSHYLWPDLFTGPRSALCRQRRPGALGYRGDPLPGSQIIKQGRLSDYAWAGVAFGLSAATKYSAGLLILPLGAAHLLSRRYHTWPQRLVNGWLLGVAGLLAVISYLVVSPFTLINWQEFCASLAPILTRPEVDLATPGRWGHLLL